MKADDSVCPCYCSGNPTTIQSTKVASARENSLDNHLYYPSSDNSEEDDVKHFQKHWVRGEAVVANWRLTKVLFGTYLEEKMSQN
jgi:lysine-specific demethylase 3